MRSQIESTASASKVPKVSIGLPVHNGGCYLENAIQSILDQTYQDFEIVISDNASTDCTPVICEKYASLDRRIRYFRSETNMGLAWNWNRVFSLSQGDYFRWTAHDDLVDARFLAVAVEVLDSDPDIVLCYSRERFIDADGRPVYKEEKRLAHVGSHVPEERFRDMVLVDHWCLPIYGLIRSAVLRETAPYGGFVAADRVLLAELALRGRFQEIPEALFSFRLHRAQSIQAISFHRRAAWINPALSSRRVFPHWRFYQEYFKCLNCASVSFKTRWICRLHLVRWWGVNWNWARMFSDLILALAPGALRCLSSFQARVYSDYRLPRS
ncbi:MAG: glycosyltransferase family 2 protein [Acidobacteriota bacterium]|nr:glycosyltransferase family 2 protein [Acidobacteriota bacterium]